MVPAKWRDGQFLSRSNLSWFLLACLFTPQHVQGLSCQICGSQEMPYEESTAAQHCYSYCYVTASRMKKSLFQIHPGSHTCLGASLENVLILFPLFQLMRLHKIVIQYSECSMIFLMCSSAKIFSLSVFSPGHRMSSDFFLQTQFLPQHHHFNFTSL